MGLPSIGWTVSFPCDCYAKGDKYGNGDKCEHADKYGHGEKYDQVSNLMSFFIHSVLLVLILTLQGILDKSIVISKHLSSVTIILLAVPESFWDLSEIFGGILISYTIEC